MFSWQISSFVRCGQMKKLTVLLSALGKALIAANPAAAAASGKQLVELESHIKWSAVDNAWKNLRPNWLTTTATCDSAACFMAQLLELESHVQWKAVDAAWKNRRSGWINDCRGAATRVKGE
jgi:hypothetical protein